MKTTRKPAVLLALLMLLSLFVLSACSDGGGSATRDSEPEAPSGGSEAGTESGAGGERESEDSTPKESGTEAETEPSVPVDRFADGTMIYYENFDRYGNESGNVMTLGTLRKNGVWRLDDQTDPYYERSKPYAAKSTCRYAIRDGKLQIMGYRDASGNEIADASDTYLVVLDENTLWELDGKAYTIQYEVTYASYANVKRYICLLWNYYGQYYNSFHLRVNGTGNLQAHKAGAWLDHDKYVASTDLYSGSLDGNSGTSIANKLLGIDLGGSSAKAILRDIPVTVRIRIHADGTATVLLSTDGERFVAVAEYHPSSEVGTGLNSHTPTCNGGALAIKTGAGINGTLDDIMIYMGHGDTPEDKTVRFAPLPIPDAGEIPLFTQESTVSKTVYNDSAYSAFNSLAKAEILVPGLKQGMIPQGMDVSVERNLLFISGYFKDTSCSESSVVLTVDLTSGKFVGEYYLEDIGGAPHTSHVGGIAVTEKNLYISSNSLLYRIPLSAFEEAGARGAVRIAETIPVPVRASFCNYSEGILWVGDFYIPNDTTYSTPEWRHMQNRAGGTYGAWCVGYRLTDATENGLNADALPAGAAFATPDIVLSIDQKIQGFAVVGDRIALSRSYGRTANSAILLYENILSDAAHRTVTLNGTEVPVWFLDSFVAVASYTMMPMSEGLAVHNGSLLILFESGATYYKDGGGKNPTDRVFRMKIS